MHFRTVVPNPGSMDPLAVHKMYYGQWKGVYRMTIGGPRLKKVGNRCFRRSALTWCAHHLATLLRLDQRFPTLFNRSAYSKYYTFCGPRPLTVIQILRSCGPPTAVREPQVGNHLVRHTWPIIICGILVSPYSYQ